MSRMRMTLRRGALMATVLAAVMAIGVPVASASPGSEATEWLSTQLKTTSEGKYCEQFGSPSVGQTIECNLAFKAAGPSFKSQAEETYKWVLANMSSYVGAKPCSEATSLSAGAVAKLAVDVEAQGADPRSVGTGGRNLIADLECLQAKSGTEKGRFKDKGTSDFSNVFGQSLAVVALRGCEKGRCTTKPNLKSVITSGAAYLVGQQCAENAAKEKVAGAYRSSMGLTSTTCNAKTPFPSPTEFNENAVEVDSTGFAIEALLRASESGAESIPAAERAGLWLAANAKETKSPPRLFWENYCSESEPTKKFPSVNSTALAIMGGAEIGISITAAKEWLADTVASGPDKGMPACTATGEGNVLATSQGILGIFGKSYAILVGL
jgi:hypothetical protein